MESLRTIIDNIDYKDFILFHDEKYNKILLAQNEKYDVYLICWRTGQKTRVHDHPSGGCLMKIVSGTLLEENYRSTTGEFLYPRTFFPGTYAFKSGDLVVHRITAMEDTVSLHVYYPSGYVANTYDFDHTTHTTT
jgi:cysteine dioxygenase